MLKEHTTIFRRLTICIDLVIVAACFFIGYFLRARAEGLLPIETYIWIIPVVVFLWGASFYFLGMYRSFRLKKMSEIIGIIIQSAIISFVSFGSITYLFHIEHISRGMIILIFILATLATGIEKLILRQIFYHLRKKGFNFRNIIIVGTNKRAKQFIRQVSRHKEFGLKIIGIVDDGVDKDEKVEGYSVLGGLKNIPEILRNQAIDYVFFIVPRSMLSCIEEPILYCEKVGATVSVAVDLFEMQFTTGKEGSFFGMPLITFESTSDKIFQLLLKRVFDFIASGLALLVMGPIFLSVSLIVKLTSKGPVFFTQMRSGLNGRKFKLYKFRTMVQDAEKKLDELKQHNEMQGPVFKMEHDPRITPIGRLFRKLSIDELPQLWNVFRGDMSLVGPRPPIPSEVEQYDHWQRRRLSMRPGITCIWQINGRNKITDFNEWMKLDLQYIDTWSLWLDLKILLQTIPVVLFAVGAK
ncbi:MAG: sugar transferase [Candidatus Omnitrophica bacterium]|nr:sugar transferase [Candidatus Omnitrophota bacterium]